MSRPWKRFIAIWGSIAITSIAAIVYIEMVLARCRCSKVLLGVDVESLPPILAAAAIGSVLMMIVGFHFRKQSR